MASVEYLREFVNERLTAAAEEIFGVFKTTIVEYEEEINRQRRLLENVWKPKTKLNNTVPPEPTPQRACMVEEALADQQRCIQETITSVDQEDPEPPQIKEEQEELCTSQEGEQLELKEETDAFMLTSSHEESDHSDDLTPYMSIDEEKPHSYTSVTSSIVSEPNISHHPLSHNPYMSESQYQTGGKHGDSGFSRDTEPESQRRHHTSGNHSDNADNPNLFGIQHYNNTQTGKRSYICDTCGKDFKFQSVLQRHVSVHTGEKPYSCKMCGKAYRQSGELTVHMRTHTGERPYMCKACGKDFGRNSSLWAHMRRTHIGEMPYLCKICGKRFFGVFELERHLRLHTDKQFQCDEPHD